MRLGRERHRGFSLIEIVIVLFLTGTMLYCVASLTDRTFKTLKFLQEKSKTLESAQLACERLSSELRECIGAPTTGATVSFRKVKPSVAYGLSNDPTDPSSWTRIYPAGDLATITYTMVVDKVIRQAQSEPPMDVAQDVNAFSVVPTTALGNYKINLTIVEDRRIVVFESVASCPGVPR